MGITGVILTRNESANIGECIDSLAPCVDSVVVWDSGSVDNTCSVARDHGAHVVHRPFDNYAAQRQAVLDSLDTEWILFVDADERMTGPLGEELRDLLAEDVRTHSQMAGCWLPRRNYIVGMEVRGGGYYPDHQLRLLRRGHAHYVPEREVHEIVVVDGEERFARHSLLHYNYQNWRQFHQKQRAYARYEASILAKRGIRPRPYNFILQPLREFRRRFITLRGYIDGWFGLRLALWLAWYYGALPYYYLLIDKNFHQDR